MYTEGPPAFRAASLAPPPSSRTWAFPWILSSAASAFLDSVADGLLEQPPNAASVITRKEKMRALRFIRHALAFETFSSESEGTTGHDRLQRVLNRPSQVEVANQAVQVIGVDAEQFRGLGEAAFGLVERRQYDAHLLAANSFVVAADRAARPLGYAFEYGFRQVFG